jgi:sodium/pantothenate symporter
MARNEHVVVRAAIYACLAVIFMQILIYGAGGFINLANPAIEPSETVMLWAAQNLVPPLLGALLLAGIVAAALSSASTFLSLVGFSVSNDLFRHRDPVRLGATRLIMGGVSIAVLGLSLVLPPNVFWIMLFIGTVFASSWGPVGFMSIWSRRITAAGAWWGMVTGFFANVIPAALAQAGLVDLPSYLDPALLGTAASFAAIIVVSRRGEPSKEERKFLARLHETPTGDRSARLTRTTLIAPALLVLYGIGMPVFLLNFYVAPYQRGAGLIAAGAGVDWSYAEPWFALGPAVLFIPLGTVAAIVIRRRYA